MNAYPALLYAMNDEEGPEQSKGNADRYFLIALILVTWKYIIMEDAER